MATSKYLRANKGIHTGYRAVGTDDVEVPRDVGFNDNSIANPCLAVISTTVLIINKSLIILSLVRLVSNLCLVVVSFDT